MRKHSRFAVFAGAAALAIPLLTTLASNANAQERENQRVFGLGSAFGAGVMGAGVIGLGGSNHTGVLPAIDLPTVELSFFLPNDWAIDLSLPLTNIIIGSALAHAFYFNLDAFLNFNLGKGNIRGVLGPGVGFDLLTASSSSGSATFGGVRVLGEAGFEALTSGRHFGFKLLARPFVEFVPVSGYSAVGGGALLMLDFMGYVTK